MKVAIGSTIKEGPWGGGNLFVNNLYLYLKKNKHEVFFDLLNKNLDLILLTDPRKESLNSTFDHIDISNYLHNINSKAIVVHRINECDERKNTNYINDFYLEANKIADHTVFVSNWIKNIYSQNNSELKNSSVIMSGSDKNIFNSKNLNKWNSSKKLKIVTHHWGSNWNKGFDVYKKLDDLLVDDYWGKLIDFKYIGNLPEGFKFKNAEYVPPLSGIKLAEELKSNHIYITGSLNEPSGNHHIESSQCGLPLLYISSGGIPEFAKDYGLSYELNNLEQKLKQIMSEYDKYLRKMTQYPFDSEKMCKEYQSLFIKLVENQQKTDLQN